MPQAVKDQNQRYYSPTKYFTIDIEKEEKSKKSLNKSFDQFNPPKLSKKRRPLVSKINSTAVARMKS